MLCTRIADPIEQTLILILSDINMPGMTGLEMLPKVREMRPDVPIIMITAYGDPETKRKAIEGGATGLLTKPIDFTLLREEIDARLGQARPVVGRLGTPENSIDIVSTKTSQGEHVRAIRD